MNLNKELEKSFEAWASSLKLTSGVVPVSVREIVKAFEAYLKGSLPANKYLVGRFLSRKGFFAKQCKETNEQTYYLNRSL